MSRTDTFAPARRMAGVIATWRDRVRGRQELAGLDLRALRDMGVTPSEVWAETAKPFWRA
jgi:uncharacterized protein YjiS (DUF1127 family)